jgi:hypothetical protein
MYLYILNIQSVSMSRTQQSNGQPIPLMSQYDSAFSQTVIPTTMIGQNYPHAQTTVFDNTANNEKESLIIVDSRFRDWDNETSSNYTYYLGQKLEYVQSIELVGGCIPCSKYVIHQDNNVLIFAEKGHEISITVPEGVYTIDTLCTKIGELMTDSSRRGYHYTCANDPVSDKVTIHTENTHDVFDLLWSKGKEIIEDGGTTEMVKIDPITHHKVIRKEHIGRTRQVYHDNSIGITLGFMPINLLNSHTYTGQKIYNLYPDEYVAIHVTDDTNDDFSNVNAQTNMKGTIGAFAVLDIAQNILLPNSNTYNNLQYTSRRRFTHFFNPPIKFTRLRIEIKKPDGQYYDFQGLDHYLVFIVQRVWNREIVGPVNRLF